MTKQYDGGYFLLNEPLVRGYGGNAHTARDLSKISQYAVGAVNAIQDTPWAINGFMYDVINKLREQGENVTVKTKAGDNVILRLQKPEHPSAINHPALQRIDPSVWAGFSTAQRREVKARKAKVLDRYEEELGVYRATLRIMTSAEEMTQFLKFYFPHNMDFRTRIYPIPSDLNPQSNDLSKGLLSFSRGTRLGEDGLYWMAVSVASQWGEDKLSKDEQANFTQTYWTDEAHPLYDIQKWVDDPMSNRGWLKADAPFQFLAVAHEFIWANRSGNPTNFMSHLPGNLDGSCNGAQHLSIMARDLVGATATNCRDIKGRNDLYLDVANRVWELLERDAAAGNPLAIEWVPLMMEPADRRLAVKRSVMTVPYGVTEYGVADFMIKDGHVSETAENQWNSAKYMRDLIINSIDETLSNGRKLQRWFQACAVKCAEAGLPICWDTPAGSKVTQAYRNIIMRRVVTLNTRFYVYEEPADDEDDESFLKRIGMNVKKMGTSAPPNVVHSCDASHLQITTCRLHDVGIRDFSMIHDSFGVPFAHVRLMRDILRQSVVDMYDDNYLMTWKESVERYSGLEMPEPPELGEFDIQEILMSEFFFA